METTSRFGTSIPVSCSSTRRYQSLELPSPSHLAMLLLFSVLICSSGNHGVHATTEPTPAHHSSSSSSSSSHQDNNQHHHHPNNDDILRHHQGNHPTTVNNDNEHHKKLYNQHHQHHNHHATNSRVLELSDRFLDIVNTAVVPAAAASASSSGGAEPSAEPKYQPWLVMFYAPWCGHCKRLEPVFNHVAQALHNTPIRVGRVDCTRFPSVGSEFKIHGYPTIMFISGPSRKHVFHGDRDEVQIVRFAKRMASPPVTLSPVPLQSFITKHFEERVKSAQSEQENPARVKRNYDHHSPTTTASEESTDKDIFFGLMKPPGYKDELTSAFTVVATKYQQNNEFYEFNEVDFARVTVFAYKQGRIVVFRHGVPVPEPRSSTTHDQQNMTSILETWVGNERFPDFIHLTRGNLYQIFSEGFDTRATNHKELVVCVVVEEDKLERVIDENERKILQVLQQVTQNAVQGTLVTVGSDGEDVSSGVGAMLPGVTVPVTMSPVPHYFAWIGTPEIANSIVAEHLPLPTLLIIQKSPVDLNHKYYVFSDASVIDTEAKIENLVELVREGHFSPTVYANSISFKLYRYAFDAKVSLTDMWVGNPVLTIVLFGLPLGFLSLILYSVCCGDIMDAKEEDEDQLIGPEDSDDEDAAAAAAHHHNHQKRE